MELHAISRRKRRHADLDLSAEPATTVRSRDQRAAEDEFFETVWDEPAATGQGPAYASDGPGPAGALASSTSQELDNEGPVPPVGNVLLAVGRSYFHDGTVGEGIYEADLPLTLLATFDALHVLARAVFSEMGAARDTEVTIACDRWLLRMAPKRARRSSSRSTRSPPARRRGVNGAPSSGCVEWLPFVKPTTLRPSRHSRPRPRRPSQPVHRSALQSLSGPPPHPHAQSGGATSPTGSCASQASPTWRSPKATTRCPRECSALTGKRPAPSWKQGTYPWPSSA